MKTTIRTLNPAKVKPRKEVPTATPARGWAQGGRSPARSVSPLVCPGGRKAYSKYGNVRTADGHDSIKESNRARELRMLEKAGMIAKLREQVQYELIPPQRDGNGHAVRPCIYVADFVYLDTATGCTVVEDSKGVRTPEYRIKKKLMLWRHGITILET